MLQANVLSAVKIFLKTVVARDAARTDNLVFTNARFHVILANHVQIQTVKLKLECTANVAIDGSQQFVNPNLIDLLLNVTPDV